MPGPLDGVRVLETGGSIATAYAGKLLADLGADVRRAGIPARPANLPERIRSYNAALDAFLHRGKREASGSLADLASESGLILTAASLKDLDRDGLEPGALADAGKVVVSITPFGLLEPAPEVELPDFLFSALGGFVYLTGLPDHTPTRNGASLPQFQAAIIGVTGGLAALLAREAGGPGDVVDVSLYESVAWLMEREDVMYTHAGHIWSRTARHKVVHPFAVFPCKDGYVSLCVASPMQFQSLCELIGHPELAADQSILLNTIGNADLIDTMLLPWLAEHGKREVTALCQERRIPSSPLLGFDELLRDEHMLSRNFFATIEPGGQQVAVPGMPYRLQ